MDEASKHIANPPEVPPAWWDTRYEMPTFAAISGSLMSCGCHLRQPDCEAILCVSHLGELNKGERA